MLILGVQIDFLRRMFPEIVVRFILFRVFQWLRQSRICLQCRRCKRQEFNPWVGNIAWRRKRQPTPVFLSGKSHGQRSLAGYGQWGHKESDTTEWLTLCSKAALWKLKKLSTCQGVTRGSERCHLNKNRGLSAPPERSLLQSAGTSSTLPWPWCVATSVTAT